MRTSLLSPSPSRPGYPTGLTDSLRHLLALLAAGAVLLTAHPALAQDSLELKLETAGSSATTKADPPRTNPRQPAPRKTAPSRTAGGRLPSLPLPSRGATSRTVLRGAAAPAPRVLAQLGVVQVDRLQVRAGLEGDSRLLSVVEKGAHLAVVQEATDHWGVLMVNNTVGWVPKAALELIDYRTEVTLREEPSPEPSRGAEGGSDATGLISGELDPVRRAILQEAFTYLGVPYVWAGNTRRGLDCSGFVKNVYATIGVKLPRHSGDQAKFGQAVQGPDLRPGDRLYFDMKNSGRISHTGIYIGNGLFIHASSNQGKVGVDSIFKSNYYRGLVAARRDIE